MYCLILFVCMIVIVCICVERLKHNSGKGTMYKFFFFLLCLFRFVRFRCYKIHLKLWIYQVPRGIKSIKLQIVPQVFHSKKRFSPREI